MHKIKIAHSVHSVHTNGAKANDIEVHSDTKAYGYATYQNATMCNMYCVTTMSDEKLVTVRAFLAPDLRNSFKSICVKRGVTMNDVIVEFIEEYVQQSENETPIKSSGGKAK